MNQVFFYKLVSGRKKGFSTALFRTLLSGAAILYSAIIRLRNWFYDKQIFKIFHANPTVISVGNITVGGTGKTPLVIWLCNYLTQNYSCAVLTRGYKTNVQERATSDEPRVTSTDEPAILAQSCPQTKVIVNPDRIAGAIEAVDKFGAEVLIMDDGFQHLRLARDLDIVTIDATLPFGYGKLLPAGLLREPVTSLKRADAVVITRCDQVDTIELDKIEQRLRLIKPNIITARSIHAPVCAKSSEQQISFEELKGKKVFAFCGIGNPNAFLNTIKSFGSELVGSKIFNDHHRYTKSDITDIYNKAKQLKADLILTTQKDWPATQYAIRNTQYVKYFAYLTIEIKFLFGRDKLTDLIKETLAGKISTSN